MWKSLVAGAAVLAITGTSVVYAQQRDHGPGARGDRGGQAQRNLSPEDRAAFNDARIAAMKAGLKLTPEQEKNWPAFETALRDIAKARQERLAARAQQPQPTDPTERLRLTADALTKAGDNLKRLADAQAPLYQSLDDSQKSRFNVLGRALMSPRPQFAQARRMHERRHGGGMHRMGNPGMQEGTLNYRL